MNAKPKTFEMKKHILAKPIILKGCIKRIGLCGAPITNQGRSVKKISEVTCKKCLSVHNDEIKKRKLKRDMIKYGY